MRHRIPLFSFLGLLFFNHAQSQSGQWTVVTSSGAPTARHECAYVKAGTKFYLIGGRGNKPVESYDPQSNTWVTETVNNPMQMHHFQAVEYNGKIYVVGAFTGNCCHETPVSNVYIFDPATKQWTTGPLIPANRRRGAAGCVVYNNKIYLVCGIIDGHSSGWVPWLDVFDPQTNTWTPLPDAPRPRDHFYATLANGKIYCIGGRQSGLNGDIFKYTIPEVDVYDIASNLWTTLPSSKNIPTQRASCATAVLGDEILVMGGEGASVAYNKTEAFNVVTQTWRTLANMLQSRHATTAVLHDNEIYIAAGAGTRGGSNELNTQEKFSFSSSSNSPPSVSISTPSNGATFTAPASITINAIASDADGSVSKVEFYSGATLLNTDWSSPYSFNWINVQAGSYVLTAIAFDNQNLSTTSAAVNISVSGTSGGCVQNEVVSFTLMRAGTAGEIGPLTDGMTINLATIGQFSIRANTCNGQNVGSVKFVVNGSTVKIESAAPYSISGDNNGSFNAWNTSVGAKILTGTPYTQGGGGGTPGVSETVSFTVVNQSGGGTPDCNGVAGGTAYLDDCGVCSGGNTGHAANSDKDACGVCFGDGSSCNGQCQPLQVTALTLVREGTAGDIGPLNEGMTIYLGSIGNFSVRADICPGSTSVKSVKFVLNGATVKIENAAPYAINGDTPTGSYKKWSISAGSYTLIATPYSGSNASGTAGIALTRNFTVANGSGKAELTDITSARDEIFKIYPNPNSGQFMLEWEAPEQDIVEIRIYNQLGQTVYLRTEEYSSALKEQLILDQPSGIYFLRLTCGSRIFDDKIIIR